MYIFCVYNIYIYILLFSHSRNLVRDVYLYAQIYIYIYLDIAIWLRLETRFHRDDHLSPRSTIVWTTRRDCGGSDRTRAGRARPPARERSVRVLEPPRLTTHLPHSPRSLDVSLSLCVPCGWRPVSECTPLLFGLPILFKHAPLRPAAPRLFHAARPMGARLAPPRARAHQSARSGACPPRIASICGAIMRAVEEAGRPASPDQRTAQLRKSPLAQYPTPGYPRCPATAASQTPRPKHAPLSCHVNCLSATRFTPIDAPHATAFHAFLLSSLLTIIIIIILRFLFRFGL